MFELETYFGLVILIIFQNEMENIYTKFIKANHKIQFLRGSELSIKAKKIK